MNGAATPVVPGRTLWAIAEGYIPGSSTGEGRALESHEAVASSMPGPRRPA